MAYQKIAVFFIALVICAQASAQGPVSAPVPSTSGADVPSFAPVSPSPVFTPAAAPPVSTPPTTQTPTLAPVISPPPVSVPVSEPVPPPVAAEVPTPSPAESAPAPGPSVETSSAAMVSATVWSCIIGLSSGLLIVLA